MGERGPVLVPPAQCIPGYIGGTGRETWPSARPPSVPPYNAHFRPHWSCPLPQSHSLKRFTKRMWQVLTWERGPWWASRAPSSRPELARVACWRVGFSGHLLLHALCWPSGDLSGLPVSSPAGARSGVGMNPSHSLALLTARSVLFYPRRDLQWSGSRKGAPTLVETWVDEYKPIANETCQWADKFQPMANLNEFQPIARRTKCQIAKLNHQPNSNASVLGL